MSDESTITKKGQITIPAGFRKQFNLQPGKKVVFIATNDGILVKPMQYRLPTLRGIIKSDIQLDTIDKKIRELRKEWRLENTE